MLLCKNSELNSKVINNLNEEINQILKKELSILKQIRAIRQLLLDKQEELAGLELNYDLGKKKYKKTPLYEGPNFCVQAFVWKPELGTVKHGHLGEWGVITVLKGQMAVTEYKIDSVDWEEASFNLAQSTKMIFQEGEVFSLVQNYNALHRMNNAGQDFAVTLHIYQSVQKKYIVYENDTMIFAAKPLKKK